MVTLNKVVARLKEQAAGKKAKGITLHDLVTPYSPKIVKFKGLAVEQRAALILYMAEGAWDDVGSPSATPKRLLSQDQLFVQAKGNTKFGLVYIPREAMLDALTRTTSWDQTKADYGISSLEEYLGIMNEAQGHLGKYKSDKWPVILSGDKGKLDELLQDGWHRFTAYINRGLKTIPCLFYP